MCEKNDGYHDDRYCRDCEEEMIDAFPDLLDALNWITRCLSISGPAETTAYIVSDERMRQAKAAVAKATGKTV